MTIASKNPFSQVIKRDGRVVAFDQQRVIEAVEKAMTASQEGSLEKDPLAVSDLVIKFLARKYPADHLPRIEEIQDAVEETLISQQFPKTAKAYILYRQERAELREQQKSVPVKVKQLAEQSKQYFRNQLSEFIYYRTYSRWREDDGRRETWIETVDRYLGFMRERLGDKLSDLEYQKLRLAILDQRVMPSMRLLWAAGPAVKASHVSAYNCSYVAPTKLKDFGEILYLLTCGTGVGFSAESQVVQQLPLVRRQTGKVLKTSVVEDSKEGWANSLVLGLKTWYGGRDIKFDYSKIRLAGARLKTMGGRASGPEPLRNVLDFTRAKILNRQGKRLTNLDVHDIICKIGEVVVSGGVRRSSLISLSDLDDQEMRTAKTGQFYLFHPERSMANNSAVYDQKPKASEFLEEWLSLVKSGTGERGIFNRGGLSYQLPARRWKLFKKHWPTAGTNPCGEIILRSKEFCNLTEVVCRADDNEKTLLEKVEMATLLGTFQSSLTDFSYLSKEWKKNCEEERLLGVSLTGQWDCRAVRKASVLKKLKEKAIAVNKKYAKRFGINPSLAITCVKPSGTVSQLVDAASGMHPRYSPYYIRRVRISVTDPLFQMLKDQKFSYYPEVGQREGMANTYVLEFPVKAPLGSVFQKDISAVEQLRFWRMVKENYTEHNPSVTISVGENEWLEVANWLYQNWEMLGGLSFLPRENHVYQLAPYEEISQERYEELLAKLPKIDFSRLSVYEKEDQTTGSKELACVGNVCELSPEEITLPKK